MTSRKDSPFVIIFTLWLLVFSAASQTMIMAPILPRIGEGLGVSDAVLGTLVSGYSLMLAVFAILAGPVSDRIGRRRILILGTGLMTLALALHGVVTSYASFLGVRVLAGMAGGVLSGAAVSYIGDYFPYNRRGWATGWVMSGAAFGQILGIPMGIFMAGRWGFRSPFYLFAVTMAATVVLLFFGVPQPPVKSASHRLSAGRAARDYLTMLKRPEVAWAAVAYFMMFLGVSVFIVYFPTWLEQEIGATPDQIALMFLAGGVANVLTGPQAGRLSDRIGRKGIILIACVGLSVLMVLTVPLVTDLYFAYAIYFLIMVLVAMRISPFSALLTSLVRDERRGSLMSLTVALGQMGFAVGGAAAGPLYSSVGFRANTLLAAVSVLAMGLIVWRFVPEPEPGTST
ncbi:MAG: MFS transporter [Gemmatimonadota bacterium]|nr:MFS transporter [Gemmatimonadota bacterium]MDH5759213.1 MFS transporter [Gemmatimonadota bacterium]